MRKRNPGFGSRCGLPPHSASSDAFTLIELMAVIFIIGLLAALVVGVSGYANAKASQGKSISDMEKLKSGFEEYRAEFGKVPAYTGSIAAAAFNTYSNQLKRYGLGLAYKDAWGNSYLYSNDTRYTYRLWSTGQDVTDPSDDISNRPVN